MADVSSVPITYPERHHTGADDGTRTRDPHLGNSPCVQLLDLPLADPPDQRVRLDPMRPDGASQTFRLGHGWGTTPDPMSVGGSVPVPVEPSERGVTNCVHSRWQCAGELVAAPGRVSLMDISKSPQGSSGWLVTTNHVRRIVDDIETPGGWQNHFANRDPAHR